MQFNLNVHINAYKFAQYACIRHCEMGYAICEGESDAR